MVYDPNFANPATIGLCGFGSTLILWNITNADEFNVDTMVLGMGMFYGGIAQVIAGIMAFKRGDTFSTTTFVTYGLFFLSWCGRTVFANRAWSAASPDRFVGWVYFLWCVFTAIIVVISLKQEKIKTVIYSVLWLMFFILAVGHWAESDRTVKAGGWIGIVAGAFCFYGGIGYLVNAEWDRVVMPLGKQTYAGPTSSHIPPTPKSTS